MKSFGSDHITPYHSNQFSSARKESRSFFSKKDPPFFHALPVQTKLTVNQPNDPYEKEADAMADQVVRNLSGSSLADSNNNPKPFFNKPNSVQRKCAECEKEEKEKKVQTKSQTTSPQRAPANIESNLSSSKGSGSSLPSDILSQMEHSFNTDFSNVKVHSDSSAIQMSTDLHAQAFTHGSDIYFNSGKYDTSSNSGKHLLAHELTHVVQQNNSSGQIQRLGDTSKAPADLPCPIANSSDTSSGKEVILFGDLSTTLSADQVEQLGHLASNWNLAGKKDEVRIDGYASKPGTEELNWRLSCTRAQNVANELNAPTNGGEGIPASFIRLFAQGETDEFGAISQNRRVTIGLKSSPPPPPAVKTITVNSTTLNGATDNADTDIATSNNIFSRNGCNVRLAKGATTVLDATQTSAILGTDNLLEEPSGDTASTEEQALTALNRSANRLTAYYVPGFNPSKRGTSLQQPSHGVPDSLLMSAAAAVDTYTHELCHILTRGRGHSNDPDNLMAGGDIRNVGVDNLTSAQCTAIATTTVYPQ